MAFDFALTLLVLTVLFGLVWGLDRAFLYRARKRRAEETGKDYRDPWPVDWSRSLFPVVLLVLVLRSFVAEPFRIPSPSMYPTLKVGDFILVNKFSYGLRLPVFHTKILKVGEPKRGDIVVFRPPWSPDQDWIKRVVGLPGDKVVVRGEQVFVNGKRVETQPIGPYAGDVSDKYDRMIMSKQGMVLDENLDGVHHHIIETPLAHFAPNVPNGDNPVTVPQNCYFVMGDNRDDSDDSRYHGCVPEKDLVGKAFFIWLSLHSMNRIGTVLH
ncbi:MULTISPECIES: signal peptidase I [Oleiagrimonas]|jgi:signal peptidase I|uniref:Signal peptidase I n=1 Tax=Oleiagrimonas citrea TaxID=1665687 RepID=A0A846ZLS5_9GAMM|nr:MULTISPECIES: signal peptidase I [Oleiagrimonas]NKZ39164.1 signal peptidase I [Oleiagrimonas citrea]RAP57764.1 signal peptidase I [Oleiagrimonas sp. MCCC 1A03011]